MQNPARFIGLALEVPAHTRKLEATDASNWPDTRGRCSSAVRVEVFDIVWLRSRPGAIHRGPLTSSSQIEVHIYWRALLPPTFTKVHKKSLVSKGINAIVLPSPRNCLAVTGRTRDPLGALDAQCIARAILVSLCRNTQVIVHDPKRRLHQIGQRARQTELTDERPNQQQAAIELHIPIL
jgi:hypothetical protein